MRYVAAPGERNHVTVSEDFQDGAFRFQAHDVGAVIDPAGTCQRVDLHTARCALLPFGGPIAFARVHIGDDDDTLARTGLSWLGRLAAGGGPGRDHLVGGDGVEVFDSTG